MSGLQLLEHNLHEVSVDGQRIMFHVPTGALFQLDEVGGAVLDLLRAEDDFAAADVTGRLGVQYGAAPVAEMLSELHELRVLRGDALAESHQAPDAGSGGALSTLVLNVNTGCNLSCTYCYKEDLAAPVDGERMDEETARRVIDLLFKEAAARERVNLVFFGGEPLTNMPLIRAAVEYADGLAAAQGKSVDFSLTTNATLLTDELIDYFNARHFGLTISMDGPKALHDLNRKTVGGSGTYDVVADKVKALLSRYTSRPVGVRVTLTPGVTDVIGIHDHLVNDLGFFEVGFSPATAADNALYNLSAEELAGVFDDMKALGRSYEKAALAGRNIGFSNMHQLMTDLIEGTRKLIPCGAGVGMLAVDKDGGLNLCHRFTGTEMPLLGSVEKGVDHGLLDEFVSGALDRSGTECETCRIRNLCSGGCYHESYARYGDPLHPTYHYCDLMRDWIDFGIKVYSRIQAENPAFFTEHVEPRRADR